MSRLARNVVGLVKKRKHAHTLRRPKAVAGRISKQEAKKKTGPKAVKWSVTASGRKRKAEGGMIHRGRKAEYEV